MPPTIGSVAVIGLGLIGGSLARRLAGSGMAVIAYDADPETRQTARKLGLTVHDDLAATLDTGTELVVLAIPAPALAEVLDAIAGHPGIVTDVTSVKRPVGELAAARGLRWVGGHPMAGTERSGFAAADPELFTDRAWVLCPDEVEPSDWLAVAELITRLGARIVPATAADHDAAVARISHLPHLAAAALTLATDENPLALTLAAGSFRDATRVSGTRPELTAAMCGTNSEALAVELDQLIIRLVGLRRMLDDTDPAAGLLPVLSAAHRIRAGWPRRPGPSRILPATPDALITLGRAGGWVTSVDLVGGTVMAIRPV